VTLTAASAPLVYREQLTNLRALLVLSILMTESTDEDQILNLAASSASSLGPWHVVGFALTGPLEPAHLRWRPGHDPRLRTPVPSELVADVAALPDGGAAVHVEDTGWSWAYPLRTAAGLLGFVVVAAEQDPTPDERFLLQVVAQQTGVALSNARLHERERTGARALAQANRALEDTVATLRRGMQIHERLTAVAAAGEGFAGIADALHELTGLAVAIEDRYGNLRAWAGPGRPDGRPRRDRGGQAELLRTLVAEGRCVRHRDRVVALASPRPDVLAFISLVDPQARADASDLVALEHCATVLAVELARLRGLADAELRLRRELLQDLLTGTDDDGAHARAEALGYDLGPAHRVLLLEWSGAAPSGATRTGDDALHAVRRALRALHVTALLGTQAGAVVIVLPDPDPGPQDWDALRLATVAELGGGRCRLAVGGAVVRPSELPRSLKEASLALRLQKASGTPERTTVHADLGVFRMFAAMPELGDVEEFARAWLGALADYDAAKGTDLVATLTQYLAHGGHYGPTTAALSVHRSTLKYRLQRIREISGHDLADPETHFNLELATRAWTTLRALAP
jgi:sugar diacid utilization regulator